MRSASSGLTRETRGPIVSGVGKSVLIQRNLARLPRFSLEPRGLPREMLHVNVPADAKLKSLAVRICQESGCPRIRENLTKWEGWDLVRHRLKARSIAPIWIDEAHHLMRRGFKAS